MHCTVYRLIHPLFFLTKHRKVKCTNVLMFLYRNCRCTIIYRTFLCQFPFLIAQWYVFADYGWDSGWRGLGGAPSESVQWSEKREKGEKKIC